MIRPVIYERDSDEEYEGPVYEYEDEGERFLVGLFVALAFAGTILLLVCVL